MFAMVTSLTNYDYEPGDCNMTKGDERGEFGGRNGCVVPTTCQ